MRNIFFGLLACFVLLFVVIGCGGGKAVAAKYQGNWVGGDGTVLYMNTDGKAGFKKTGKEVTGGGAEIDESAKTLTVSLFGITETWHIDQEPSEAGEMKLGGVNFKRR